jgi:flagellar biosynthesis anti-sigma factor FlgM
MRIDLSTNGVQPDQITATRKRVPEPAVRDGAPEPILREGTTAGGDRVRFSFDPKQVQSLQAQVLAQPDVRETKVAALQQSIAKGEYSISTSQLADAMVAELGGGSQG